MLGDPVKPLYGVVLQGHSYPNWLPWMNPPTVHAPVAPAPPYKSTTAYPSALARPTPYPMSPISVPTTFNANLWRPLYKSVTSASYVLDPIVQLNTADGYPWTEKLRDGSDTESIKAKLPSVLFYPNKSLDQYAAKSNTNFNPHPEPKSAIPNPKWIWSKRAEQK